MGLVKAILSFVLLGIFLWLTIVSVGRYLDAQENLEIAQAEYDNTMRYGCPNPTVMTGLVSCP